MWIFTKHGFVSAVQHRDKPDILIVRARNGDHLRDVLGMIDDEAIEHTPNADYPYRNEVSGSEFAKLMADMVGEIDYDNFKNAAMRESSPLDEGSYVDALHNIWQIGHSLTPDLRETRAIGDLFDDNFPAEQAFEEAGL